MGPYPMTASSCSRSVPNRRRSGDLRSSAPPGICTHRRTHDDSPVSPDRAWRASLPKFREVAAVIWIVGCSGWRAERRCGGMFDTQALYRALDTQRAERELTWPVSRELWEMSAELATAEARTTQSQRKRSQTLLSAATRPASTRLFMLRWLGRIPEDFVADAPATTRAPLPTRRP